MGTDLTAKILNNQSSPQVAEWSQQLLQVSWENQANQYAHYYGLSKQDYILYQQEAYEFGVKIGLTKTKKYSVHANLVTLAAEMFRVVFENPDDLIEASRRFYRRKLNE